MPTAAVFFLLLLLVSSSASAVRLRRILHQPFFPADLFPPAPAPELPPEEPTKYPFSTSTPTNYPFFPSSYPSPPPPPAPDSFADFPDNVSSTEVPRPSKHSPTSSKFIPAAVATVIAAVLVVSLAVFIHFRKPRGNAQSTFTRSKTRVSDGDSTDNRHVPKLHRASQNSAQFLYLDTVLDSRAVDGGSSSQKVGSPELRPLPPLKMQQVSGEHFRNSADFVSSRDDDSEEFHSPNGSISGRQKRIDGGSVSKGDFNGYTLHSSLIAGSRSVSPANNFNSSNPNSRSALSAPPSPSPSSSSSQERRSQESSPRISNFSDQNVETSISTQHQLNAVVIRISPAMEGLNFTEPALPDGYSRSVNLDQNGGNLAEVGDLSESLLPMNSSLPERCSTDVEVESSSPSVSIPPPPPPPPPRPPSTSETPRTQDPIDLLATAMPLGPFEFPSSDPLTGTNNVPQKSQMKIQNLKEDVSGNGESSSKPKLKQLHWDKVRATSDREMVWDQLKSSSFKLDEKMIETLFVVNTPKQPSSKQTTRWQVLPSPSQDNADRVLDPKKSQNIAILLKALHVTVDEVRDGLLEGNADVLGTELLESLLKMAPTNEEEQKLKEHKEDSPAKLGAVEKFLKAIVDIPYAFKRLEVLLYISNFDSEVEYLGKAFATLEAACEELRTSRMFLKLLEAVLKTGNRMNVGTNRGDAQAFKLDTLLKLVDVKGVDGRTTLLHFVVQEMIRSEGSRSSEHEYSTANDDLKCRKLGLQVVAALSLELSSVKKTAVMDAQGICGDAAKLSKGLATVKEIARVIELGSSEESTSTTHVFSESINRFITRAEDEVFKIQAQEKVALSLVKELTEYFHGNSAMEEAHPLRIFMVVRDFLTTLDRVCKEVRMMNERTVVSSAHKFPVPVNPMLQLAAGGVHKQQVFNNSDDENLS